MTSAHSNVLTVAVGVVLLSAGPAPECWSFRHCMGCVLEVIHSFMAHSHVGHVCVPLWPATRHACPHALTRARHELSLSLPHLRTESVSAHPVYCQ